MLKNDRLVLDTLTIGTGGQRPGDWLGFSPVEGEFLKYNGMWDFRDVALPIEYSGGLVVGREMIQDFYVHMGFQSPYAYEQVREPTFRDGLITQTFDRSAAMQEARADHESASRGRTDPPSKKEIRRFMDDAFSLAYDVKWHY